MRDSPLRAILHRLPLNSGCSHSEGIHRTGMALCHQYEENTEGIISCCPKIGHCLIKELQAKRSTRDAVVVWCAVLHCVALCLVMLGRVMLFRVVPCCVMSRHIVQVSGSFVVPDDVTY